jgi:hypothetical protein
MQQKLVLIFGLLCVALGSASLALAHGSSFSHEEVKDGYTIDIGYNEFIAADESARFDFAIYPENSDTAEGEVFTDVWVTITQDKKAYFAGGIDKPVFGATGFTYAFPKEGSYVLSARFQKDGDTVVATEFPIEIIPPSEEKKELPSILLYVLFAVSGLLVGVAAGVFIPRKNKSGV